MEPPASAEKARLTAVTIAPEIFHGERHTWFVDGRGSKAFDSARRHLSLRDAFTTKAKLHFSFWDLRWWSRSLPCCAAVNAGSLRTQVPWPRFPTTHRKRALKRY